MPGSKENDVCLFYNEAEEDKANGIRSELEKLNMTVRSYEDYIAGTMKTDCPTSVIETSWTVVLIVTDAFVNDGMNAYETAMALITAIEREKRPMVVPVKYCDTSNFPSSLGVYNEIEGISGTGDLIAFDTIAKKIQGNVELNKSQAAKSTHVNNPLPARAGVILNFTSKALIDYFEMDRKMKDLHETLKRDMENNVPDSADQQDWIKLINVKIKGDWKQGRSKGLYFEKNVSSTMKDKHPEEVGGLDRPKGHFCLAFLLLGNKQPLKKFNECANLAEYLDPDAILELLKRCPVFPHWNDSQRKAFDDLKNDRIQDAHRSVSEPADREQKLIDSTAESALNAFNELVVSPFQAKIEELKGALQAPNQSDAPEDQQDDTAS